MPHHNGLWSVGPRAWLAGSSGLQAAAAPWSSGGTLVADEPSPGTFPWPPDYRDPNSEEAWGAGEKALFVFVYVLLWASVCVVVHFWPALQRLFRHLRVMASARVSPEADSAAARPGQDRLVPLLDMPLGEDLSVGPKPDYPSDRRVIEIFEERARAFPGAAALVVPESDGCGARTKTYSEFGALVSEVAESLLALDVGLGRTAALVLDRSVAQLVAVYGVLKAGAAFLPVDADAPVARKQLLLVESEAAVVLSASGDEATAQLASELCMAHVALPADGALGSLQVHRPRVHSSLVSRSFSGGRQVSPGAEPEATGHAGRPEATDMALLIYTSGTTGAPKGIVYDHRHLSHGVHFFGRQCGMDHTSVAMLKSPYFWAVIEWEMFPALTCGGSLVVAPPAGHKSPEWMVSAIKEHGVTVLMVTPQVLDLMLDVHEARRGARALGSLKHIVTVGEPLPSALANRTVRLGGLAADLHNFYGASESSCTVYTVPRPAGVDLSLFPNKAPAGLPQPHASVHVMAVSGQPPAPGEPQPPLARVASGEAGEICFGGVLAAGYWKHDELTREKWVETEHGLLYRTGDMGRWRGGVLEVVGRTDRQVKIRGVRVEPEEVEAVLKRFMLPAIPDCDDMDVAMEAAPHQSALKEVSVVASKEPSELVAFVSHRFGGDEVTVDMLRAHCHANLTPSYVPKFFVILPELPRLGNGKPNLAELRERATAHASEEGEMVMDSLGQMKKLSKWAIFETEVIHRCYAYWMIGVLTDHYMHCALDQKGNGDSYYPFCTVLARKAVPPWTELMVRAFGNDQDMFGFIMLGAYQDSRPDRPGQPPRVKLGLKDAFVFLVYLAMAMPFPQMLHLVFGSWAWPHTWGSASAPKHVLGWGYMQMNSYTSDHRWYLEMVLQVRIYMQICEKLRIPGWVQGLVATAICLLPSGIFEEGEYAFDICEGNDGQSSVPTYVMYTFSWLFRNWGDGCAIYYCWIQWYFAFYVWCFHYLRPIASRLQPRLPKGRTWAAASLGASMTIGILMAMLHYPNNVLENGTGLQWAALEIGADILQPVLFVLGMTHLPLNLAWWGNTTLGCYVFHFYFRDQFSQFIVDIAPSFQWDGTGLLLLAVILGLCLLITSVLGPLGHYFLLSPSLLYARMRRRGARTRAPAGARRPSTAANGAGGS